MERNLKLQPPNRKNNSCSQEAYVKENQEKNKKTKQNSQNKFYTALKTATKSYKNKKG